MAVTTDVPSNREQQPHQVEVATVEISNAKTLRKR